MRARLALMVSGTACELREVKLSAKPGAMLAASPKGTVPVLVTAEGEVIDESIDIMRRSLAQNDPEGWLERDAPDLIARNDSTFKHDLDRYKYPERHGSDALAHREAGLEVLLDLDARLAGKGQLCGAKRGLADMAIMPFIRQFAAVDRTWFDTLPLRHLKPWLEAHLESDLFKAIMLRVKPWSPGDPIIRFAAPQRTAP
ncbi:hypothetical protein NSU_4011 [Novosphingobium pentaromativorans US6-1]|uniref:GST N-terminal domain-containing protein n=2 Tax=Novosphingobium pentaromativorans TaxID=205844 RepID=G6EI40_9SPHN|nr:hypothetical protein NSU_4011 [Novosphingobium pentaromativorans US6-1]